MFVDKVTIECQGGDGGSGCMSFRRETHVPRGGPDGGDGGRGGHIIIRANDQIGSLAHLIGHKHWNADRGDHGQGSQRHGARGRDAVIQVPPGTVVRDAVQGHILRDLEKPDDQLVVARGGRGGKGNKRFATSTNQAPREFQKGKPGQYRKVTLELKLIADVGFIGMPNAGKSTLLSRLSRAHPEIADYPFTTKSPNLGVVQVGYDQQFVAADIPGLIEGAHKGVGLGHEFLRHVERTRVLVHLVEPMPQDQTDPVGNYNQIRSELREYNPELAEKPEIVVVTKCELPPAESVAARLQEQLDHPVLRISAVTGSGLPQLVAEILKVLEEVKPDA